jgi:uncharacterized protein (DUF2164 family)
MAEKVELKQDSKEALEKEIYEFFNDELDTDLNNLQIQLIIKFMTARLGGVYYNQGLQDAKEFLKQEYQLISENVRDLMVLDGVNINDGEGE